MMKKIILMLGIAAMSFASCSKDIVKETNIGHAIDFRVTTHTRGTETNIANLSTFYVTALDEFGDNYFSNVAYTKVNEYFSSSPAYYWPGDGSSLDFYAYAPSATTLGATITIDNEVKTLKGFSPAAEITNQVDFITANTTGSKENASEGLAVMFNHQLTQVEVKAKNANEGYEYKIKGVKIAQISSKGDFDFSTSQWTLYPNEKAVYEVKYGNPIILSTYGQSIMESNGDNAMLLPQQLVKWDPDTDPTNSQKGAYISVYAQVTSTAGAQIFPEEAGEYGWLAVPIDTEWKAGNKYVYTLDFTEGAGYLDPIDGSSQPVTGKTIGFNVNITPWEEKSTTDPIEGIWEIKKFRMVEYHKETDTTTDETIDNEAFIIENLDPTYHKFEFISPTETYFYGEFGRQIIAFSPKDGKLFALDEIDSKIYFEWDDESKTTLKLVIFSEDDTWRDWYYMYYKKRETL